VEKVAQLGTLRYEFLSHITVIKSRSVRRTGNLLRTWEKGSAYRILVGKLEGKRLLAYPDVDGKEY
jgi:hypothetical protein